MNMFTFLRLRKTSNVFIPNLMAKAMNLAKREGCAADAVWSASKLGSSGSGDVLTSKS
jgi:hypothetical protein